ncbi:hypothetical protein WA026_001714 [Henosepilachna vigintioctopunctata]|uniref:Nudix hydrolase domain-containing protein n=1 Tax=Henosepilachna vigintioctopunctata TaxID=420089 RepID=A0AAW1URS6_9CUCU
MLPTRIRLNCMCKRTISNLYSPENLLSQENREKTVSKFVNAQPIRRQSHLPSRKAAVLIPLCIMDGKVSLLYTLRTSNLKSHRGQVSFPGGMQDDSDRSVIETALRETHEELGIDPEFIDVWGTGNQLAAKGKTTVTPVIGCITKKIELNDLKVNRDEVEEAFYVNLEDLINPKFLGYTQFRHAYCMPVFTGGKMRIWGLTGVITYMFLQCLLPSRAYAHRVKQLPMIKVDKNVNDKLYES